MTRPRKKLLERIIDQFVVIKTDILDRSMTRPRKKLLERIIDQFVVIKTDIWDKKNDKTKKEAAGENNRSISCH